MGSANYEGYQNFQQLLTKVSLRPIKNEEAVTTNFSQVTIAFSSSVTWDWALSLCPSMGIIAIKRSYWADYLGLTI